MPSARSLACATSASPVVANDATATGAEWSSLVIGRSVRIALGQSSTAYDVIVTNRPSTKS